VRDNLTLAANSARLHRTYNALDLGPNPTLRTLPLSLFLPFLTFLPNYSTGSNINTNPPEPNPLNPVSLILFLSSPITSNHSPERLRYIHLHGGVSYGSLHSGRTWYCNVLLPPSFSDCYRSSSLLASALCNFRPHAEIAYYNSNNLTRVVAVHSPP
jgi:hypothetical protein